MLFFFFWVNLCCCVHERIKSTSKKNRIFWYERAMRKCLCNFGTKSWESWSLWAPLSCHVHIEVQCSTFSNKKNTIVSQVTLIHTVVTFEKSFHFQNLTPYKLCHSFLNSNTVREAEGFNGNAKPNSWVPPTPSRPLLLLLHRLPHCLLHRLPQLEP